MRICCLSDAYSTFIWWLVDVYLVFSWCGFDVCSMFIWWFALLLVGVIGCLFDVSGCVDDAHCFYWLRIWWLAYVLFVFIWSLFDAWLICIWCLSVLSVTTCFYLVVFGCVVGVYSMCVWFVIECGLMFSWVLFDVCLNVFDWLLRLIWVVVDV